MYASSSVRSSAATVITRTLASSKARSARGLMFAGSSVSKRTVERPFSGGSTVAPLALGATVLPPENGLSTVRFETDDPANINPRALRALLDGNVRVITVAAEERTLEDAYMAILAEARG